MKLVHIWRAISLQGHSDRGKLGRIRLTIVGQDLNTVAGSILIPMSDYVIVFGGVRNSVAKVLGVSVWSCALVFLVRRLEVVDLNLGRIMSCW